MKYLDVFNYIDLIDFAIVSNDAGLVRQSEGLLKKAVSLVPELPMANERLGRLCLKEQRFEEANRYFQREFHIRRGLDSRYFQAVLKKGQPLQISPAKVIHDVEQLEYLKSQKKLSARHFSKLSYLRGFVNHLERQNVIKGSIELTGRVLEATEGLFNSALNVYQPGRLKGPAVNPKLKWAEIERRYFKENRVIFIDDFLVPEALAKVRRICQESTIWYEGKPWGFVGAYMKDGLSCGLLFQIAAELQERLPKIYGKYTLAQAWAYKYDSRLKGIGVHADQARVNCNFWITPDVANLDADTGGLVVWPILPPAHWSFSDYNIGNKALRFLNKQKSKMVQVPYRQNRMVIFDSMYFHRTDDFRFKTGYENRRTNMTLLFGYSGK